MVDPVAIRARYEAFSPHLDERSRRVLATSTIVRGLDELTDTAGRDASCVRPPGGGRKPLVLTDASLMDDLLSLIRTLHRIIGDRIGNLVPMSSEKCM